MLFCGNKIDLTFEKANYPNKYTQNELYAFKIQNTIQYIATFIQNC